MVVHNLHVEDIVVLPVEADSPSVIDANRILVCSISFEFLQMIGGRHPQIIEAAGTVQHPQFAQRRPEKIRRHFTGSLSAEDLLSLFVLKRSDHKFNLPHLTLNVKGYSSTLIQKSQMNPKTSGQLTPTASQRILYRVTVINRQW